MGFYKSIDRLNKAKEAKYVRPKQTITVEEKIDGANASFKLDNGGLNFYSRKRKLDATKNNLSGFYDYMGAKLKGKELLLNPNYQYFGEWLVPHKVQYKKFREFYLFDILDTTSNLYLPYEQVVKASKELNLELAPLLYEGEFIDIDHLISFVGQSILTEVEGAGEGVVVKYIDEYGDRASFKIISEEFSERKITKPRILLDQTPEGIFCLECVNKARVEKIIFKLQDENLLAAELDFTNMKALIQQITPLVYEDIIKEESDDIEPEWNVGKAISKIVPVVLREIIGEM